MVTQKAFLYTHNLFSLKFVKCDDDFTAKSL